MMSLEEAVGRVQSIMSMERALVDPVAYVQTQAASSAVPATGTTGGSSFSNQLNSALVSGTGATGSTVPTGGAALTGGGSRVQAMIQMANSLVGKPYVWGGGHSGWGTQSGYDCSGFVSAVLHAGGYLSAPADTSSMPSQPGSSPDPGQYVTIYDRTVRAGRARDHPDRRPVL